MRAYILVDYEGATGVVSWEEEAQTGPTAMAGDANAAIAGLRKGGFDRFVVRDYHGSGRTIVPLDLDPAALLIRGRSMPFPYGLSSSYDAMVFVGAHAKAGTATGVISHTMTSNVADLRINGRSIGEIGGYALLAGHFGIPIILVAGDSAACEEASEVIPGVEVAPVKVGLTRGCAQCLHPMAARDLIEQKAASAARNLRAHLPVKWDGPFVLEVSFVRTEFADGAHGTLGGERVDDLTVRVERETVAETLQCFERGFK